jgi:hypothetical protein
MPFRAMTRHNTASVFIAAALFVAGVSAADAWTRSATTVGPRGGVWHSAGSGSCAGGTCSSRQTLTGPNGGAYTRQGTTTCAGGSCNRSATFTGPNGGAVTRSGTSTRY